MTADLPKSELKKSRCPKCKSTERTGYTDVRSMSVDGVMDDGSRYDTVIWRRTRCKACNQTRIDKSFELQGKQKTTSAKLADSKPAKKADAKPKADKPSRKNG